MEPGADADRVCIRRTSETRDDEHEVQAPAQTTDRICVQSLTGCMSKQYELKVPTKTSDRVGAKVTEVDRKTHKNEEDTEGRPRSGLAYTSDPINR